ncbi:MAG: hypothetical protein ACPG5B_09800 [Chitinophagales bacterium]
MADNNQNMNASGLAQIHAIRDILMGSEIQQFNTEFEELKRLLAIQRSEIDAERNAMNDQIIQTLADLEDRLNEQMRMNHEEILAKISQLDDDKLDRRQLGTMLIEIGNQISM